MGTRTRRRIFTIGLVLAVAATGCGGGGDDDAAPDTDDTTTTTADATDDTASEAPDDTGDTTTPEATDDTGTDDTGTDGSGADDPAALCAASSDTADLDSRQALLDALTEAWLETELLTELEGGESFSFLGCADGRAEALHTLASGTQELVVFTVADAVTVEVAQDPATACAATETSASARSALGC